MNIERDVDRLIKTSINWLCEFRGWIKKKPYIDINDICKMVIDALILLFADKTKVAKVIQSETDRRGLQEIIDKLHQWAQKWDSMPASASRWG